MVEVIDDGFITHKPKSNLLKSRVVEFSRKEAPANLVSLLAETDAELSESEDKLNHIEKLCEEVRKSSLYEPFTYPKIIVDDILAIIKEE